MNHAINILGGGPIRQFSDDNIPTVRDVLRYYMQFWKLKGTESKREKIVARDLMAFYQHRNINIMSEPGIKYKVKRVVNQLKSIVKSRKRPKTCRRANFVTEFMNRLDSSFQIAVAEPRNVTSDVIILSNQPGTSRESENDGKICVFFFRFSSKFRQYNHFIFIGMDCLISSNSDEEMHESDESISHEQYYDFGSSYYLFYASHRSNC